MIKVLFICLGNICRSPLAEAIFTHKVKLRGLEDQLKADSCGTGDYHIGELPDERTINCAKKHGIEINHRGRQLNKLDFKNFDYLLVMDSSNMKKVRQYMAQLGLNHDKIFMLRDLDSVTGLEVPDPYYGNEDNFLEVYNILDEATEKLLTKILQKTIDV